MKCFHCGKKKDLWAMELYNDHRIDDIFCCKKSEKCKLKTWEFMKSVTSRKTVEDVNNSIEIWNAFWPKQQQQHVNSIK